jgi:iron complex outermembrane receptor protein
MIRLNFLAAALASAGVLTLCGPAIAQQTAGDAPAVENAGDVKKEKPAAEQLPEVIVTAQKRLQSSSKVPVALSVITADDLKSKGISTAADLTNNVPNVLIGQGVSGGMEITIRGLGNSDNSERGDPQTAFHIDGIYLGRPQGAGATFFDVERVEVLRGPQGTLYGRNANAGAINVITKKPSAKLEGEVNGEIGTYGEQKTDAMLNVPVSDSFALRAVISSQKHDGYTDTATTANGYLRDRDDQTTSLGVWRAC